MRLGTSTYLARSSYRIYPQLKKREVHLSSSFSWKKKVHSYFYSISLTCPGVFLQSLGWALYVRSHSSEFAQFNQSSVLYCVVRSTYFFLSYPSLSCPLPRPDRTSSFLLVMGIFLGSEHASSSSYGLIQGFFLIYSCWDQVMQMTFVLFFALDKGRFSRYQQLRYVQIGHVPTYIVFNRNTCLLVGMLFWSQV